MVGGNPLGSTGRRPLGREEEMNSWTVRERAMKDESDTLKVVSKAATRSNNHIMDTAEELSSQSPITIAATSVTLKMTTTRMNTIVSKPPPTSKVIMTNDNPRGPNGLGNKSPPKISPPNGKKKNTNLTNSLLKVTDVGQDDRDLR